MKKTFYILKNTTGSAGQYLLNDEYCYLNPGERVVLEAKPTNHTINLTLSMYRKEVGTPKVYTRRQVSNLISDKPEEIRAGGEE